MDQSLYKPFKWIFIIFGLLALFFVLWYTFLPVYTKRATLVETLDGLRKENSQMSQEIADVKENHSRLNDPEYLEHLARKSNMVRPGDVVLDIKENK